MWKSLLDEEVSGKDGNEWDLSWINFSLLDEPWAKFSTLEAAACIPCTY
jgi:hypothetical protein